MEFKLNKNQNASDGIINSASLDVLDVQEKRRKLVTSGCCMEYGLNSTVHGVRYLFDRKLHWLERLFWVLAFAMSVYGCGRLIVNLVNKWEQSPVIVSLSERSTPVWQIPFPAVTICPESKANISMINFTTVYHEMMRTGAPPYNLTEDVVRRMAALAQVCDAHLTDGFELGANHIGPDIIKTLRELAANFEDTMFMCKFRNDIRMCSDYFQEIMTEEGLCFTFNVLNSKEIYKDSIAKEFLLNDHNLSATDSWSLETGYKKPIPIDPQTYPFRVFGSGARVGLFVLLRQFEQHMEYLCRGPVQGFKILLHTPGEVPQVSKHYFRVPLLKEVLVSVKPNIITTSERLRHYEPNRRQCYFNTEKDLRFFRVYTQRNCELECLTNFTMHHCGCVKFSMPRDDQTPICGASKIRCYNEAEDELLKQDFLDGLSESQGSKGCNCLPACTSITYDAEISQAQFDWVNLFKAYGNPLDEFPGMQPSRLSIFFKETQFITSKRSELYGPTDFLANIGGLLGLFMGVSLLSIVELFYYCTLRIWCNIKERRHRYVPT